MEHGTLTIESTDHFRFEISGLVIEVLGGIAFDRIDALRVTLKVQKGFKAIRYNLDLYQEHQLNTFLRKTSAKLSLKLLDFENVIESLTSALESHRLENRTKDNVHLSNTYQMTQDEVEAAKMYLESPDLIERTNEDIGKSGVIGEETNRMLMYMVFSSRKQAEPLNIISLGSSGVGKSHLQEKLSELIPEEECIEITDLSENAFYYFDRYELKNKLLLIEDMEGVQSALYPIRELQSKKRISKSVVRKFATGEMKTVNLRVEGPVCVAGCTTQERIYEDNSNRSYLIYIDESAEQDRRIMEYQRALSSGRIKHHEMEAIKKILRNTQRLLRPIKVVNPYADKLVLPSQVFKPRRTNAHYLHFIQTVTYYHQYQRTEKIERDTGEVYIETTLEDIRIANELIKEALIRKSDYLSGACRNYFESLKDFLLEKDQDTFFGASIRRHFRLAETTARRYHKQLCEVGYIEVVGKQHSGYEYELKAVDSYEDLCADVSDILDQTFRSLLPPQKSPEVRHYDIGEVYVSKNGEKG